MKKSDLGTKRKCEGCNAKFYDLNRDPVTCPYCKAELVVETPTELKPEESKPTETKSEVEEVKPEEGPEIISIEDVEPDQLRSDIQGIEDEDSTGNEESGTFIDSDDESDLAEIVTESNEEEAEN